MSEARAWPARVIARVVARVRDWPWRRWVTRPLWLPWALVLVPALLQLWQLVRAVAGRFWHPYDLEWMEGGMLAHSARLLDDSGIYVEPSIDFIPYLYTPLYPALVALLEPIFGLSYQVARGISVLSLLAIAAILPVALTRGVAAEHRRAGWVGAVLAAGFLAATYPWVDGWYDIARADTLFLAMILAGLTALVAWARTGHGWSGHARVGAAAAILALSFFCKQTGVLYVAAGGFILLVLNWRRVPVYVAVAAVIGLGGTWIMNRLSGGWFWTYIFEVHQAHDTNSDRFWQSFENILFKFPAMTAVIALGLLLVAVVWVWRRERPPSSGPLLCWSWVFAVSCLVGALGWATQWAHFNAYIPAMATGGAAAGATLPAVLGALSQVLPTGRRWSGYAPAAVALLVAGGLGAQLWQARWRADRFLPRQADVVAGDRLIERIRAIEGEVFIPFHPWYGHLAGKSLFVHRMGVMDVSYADPRKRRGKRKGQPPPWPVTGLIEAFSSTRFAAIIWDNRPVDHYFRGLRRNYRLDDFLPREERPRLYSGAKVVPTQIWVPAVAQPLPAGASALWRFEDGSYRDWSADGKAWGRNPVSKPVPQQGPVRRYGGKYFLTSMHGGDRQVGTLRSQQFTIAGSRITLLIGGGNQPDKLHADLVIGGRVVHTATGDNSERFERVEWDVRAYRGQVARIELVDDARGSWGHLNIDEIWQWQ